MAHGTYNNPRAGNNSSKTRMNKLANKYNANQQQKAEKRTRKSELIGEFGRNIGKAKFKAEYASDKQKQKAQQRTIASKEMAGKGIEMNKRGYAKRRQVEKSGSLTGGDFKKTKTIYTKSGEKKRTKTVTQTTPVQKEGVFNKGDAIVKVEKEKLTGTAPGKSTTYRRKSNNPVDKAVTLVGAVGIPTLGAATRMGAFKNKY